jgi:hypothetical protein
LSEQHEIGCCLNAARSTGALYKGVTRAGATADYEEARAAMTTCLYVAVVVLTGAAIGTGLAVLLRAVMR